MQGIIACMQSLKHFDPRPLWQRAKWTVTVIGLFVLAGLFVMNRMSAGEADVDRDIILAIGALLSFYLGAEGAQDFRVKSTLAGKASTSATDSDPAAD